MATTMGHPTPASPRLAPATTRRSKRLCNCQGLINIQIVGPAISPQRARMLYKGGRYFLASQRMTPSTRHSWSPFRWTSAPRHLSRFNLRGSRMVTRRPQKRPQMHRASDGVIRTGFDPFYTLCLATPPGATGDFTKALSPCPSLSAGRVSGRLTGTRRNVGLSSRRSPSNMKHQWVLDESAEAGEERSYVGVTARAPLLAVCVTW